MNYLMGIDAGTTAVKLIIIDERGKTLSSETQEYPLFTPKTGWAEQNPSDWRDAVIRGIKNILEKSKAPAGAVRAIGLTGQMHGSVFLNSENRVIHPAILWCDQRTAKECGDITAAVGKSRIFEITCNPVLTGFQAPKILWLRNNNPGVYRQVAKVLLPKDYIRFILTGEFATDVSDASGTSLFDVVKRRWSDEILEKLDIPRSFLPECSESTEITGRVTKEAAGITGLKAGTPVAAGAGDQAAGAVGSGIVEKGLVSVSLGTSGVIFAHSDDVFVDPKGRLHTFCHAVPGKWHLMGVMLSAGGSLRWLRNTLFSETENYNTLTAMAEKTAPGSEGLLFLPYLTGERCPYPDPDARGIFFGLSLKHKKEHLVRAVMEGVSFGLKDSVEIMKDIGVPVGKRFRISGGGGKSGLWCQMIADIFNGDAVRLAFEEGPSYGAAILAGTGAGMYPGVRQACRELIKEDRQVFRPDAAKNGVYNKFYALYNSLYGALEGQFDKLAEIS
ncbi:MAG: xylulokinase [Candidatus Omnitrophica bacterium]|nr:xylulokinase [Candidatus Omnitrophota bacterium]